MCFGSAWSALSFAVLAGTSLAGLYYHIPIRIVLGTSFLAVKELIQVLLYHHLDACTDMNKFLTIAAWIHISFQPLFMNLFISAFSATPKKYDVPLAMCLIFAIANTFRLKDFHGGKHPQCVPHMQSNLCRQKTCSTPGKYHLAYGFALNSADEGAHTPSLFAYFLLMFGPALIIGDWLLGIINITVSIMSFTLVAHDSGEASAIWCVNSMWIAFFAVYYIVKNRL